MLRTPPLGREPGTKVDGRITAPSSNATPGRRRRRATAMQCDKHNAEAQATTTIMYSLGSPKCLDIRPRNCYLAGPKHGRRRPLDPSCFAARDARHQGGDASEYGWNNGGVRIQWRQQQRRSVSRIYSATTAVRRGGASRGMRRSNCQCW